MEDDDKIAQALSAAKSVKPPKLADTFSNENVTAAQVSPRPGKTYGQIHSRTITQQNIEAVGRAALRILDRPQTRRFIAKHFGVNNYKVTPVMGTWEGEPEPSFTIDAPGMTPEISARLASALGFGMLQDAAVQYVHHPNVDLDSGIPTMLVGSGKVLSDEQRAAIMAEAAARGHDLTFTRDGKAAKFSFFGDEAGHEKFVRSIVGLARATKMPKPLTVRTDGDLIDAKNYLSKIMGSDRTGTGVQGGSGEPSDIFRGLIDHIAAPYTRAAIQKGYRFNLEKVADFHGLNDPERDYLYQKVTPSERRPPAGIGFGRTTVSNPVSYEYPGIYGNPREMAAEAASRVSPESPNLKKVFGVTRADLYEMGQNRVGNMEPSLAMAPNPKGSAATEKIQNPQNEQRLLDILYEAGKFHQIRHGMDAWYVNDPLYQAMELELGPEEAKKRFIMQNTLTGMASPASEVPSEINRGMAAFYLAGKGRFGDFERYAGLPVGQRGSDFPEDIRDVIPHPYHSTSHAGPMRRFLERGEVEMGTPKVPTYIPASGVPQTGFQTTLPVPDAHFTRIIGMGDTRTSSDPGVSMKMPEYQQVAPWFKNRIAAQAGLQSVPAQGRLWGAGSGSTGVTSPIGAPKLEMLADHIASRAAVHGITPEDALKRIITGEIYAKGGKVAGESKFGADAVQNAVNIARQLKRGRP